MVSPFHGQARSADATVADQRQRLLDNVIFYLGMTREEQCSRLAGGIPTSEEYWKFRDGASAVEVCLAMVE